MYKQVLQNLNSETTGPLCCCLWHCGNSPVQLAPNGKIWEIKTMKPVGNHLLWSYGNPQKKVPEYAMIIFSPFWKKSRPYLICSRICGN